MTENEKKPTKALLPLAALSGALAGFAAVQDWAIRHFGTDDKPFLQLGILAVLALFARALGIVALRSRRRAPPPVP
ncbi:hypothetical protein M2283_002149 [Streptomyces pseudovenezuelae]|uniref:Integral membrane protein n=1 Tax=Streptomyces pseudovenezuelae TaxID=67350 RepID=A0ABT6LEW9_9ACTN|nr:hypothetical protein [Streptomyces pseudovenezuelae]